MSKEIKELFGRSNNILSKTSTQDLINSDSAIESSEHIQQHIEQKKRFIPPVDFSTASNFVVYGSAEQYAIDSIKSIHNTYPYDGSLTEKIEWLNDANYYDLYVFENLYPRTCGYAVFSPDGWGTQAATVADMGWGASYVFGLSSDPEYIQVKAGPHADPNAASKTLAKQFPEPWDGTANIWDDTTGVDRVSNIVLDPEQGWTVEFWIKKDGYVSSSATSRFEALFDVWNGQYGTAEGECYGRWALALDGASSSPSARAISTVWFSGSNFVTTDVGLKNSEVLDGNWHHVAIAFQSGSDWQEINTYLDGVHHATKEPDQATRPLMGAITGSLIANIGAARRPAFTHTAMAALSSGQKIDGYAKLSGSIDEFRFWKKPRTPKQISRFWNTQIAGGTNTDNNKFSGSIAPVDLGFYYKFNEGNTGNDTTDATVLDYSGRISNGTWTGFISGSSRVAGPTSSAIVESSASVVEFKDPIIYSSHPDVVALSSSLIESGREWDIQNNAALYNTIPEWISSEDRETGGETLKKILQVMGSYYDMLHMQIKTSPSINYKKYPSTETIYHIPNGLDISNYSNNGGGKTIVQRYFNKPSPFSRNAVEDAGMIAPEIFSGVDHLAQLSSRDETREFEKKLYDIKNSIYQNIYNNLTYIYKSKGTEKSIRNLIRCYGVDDRLVKMNLYTDDAVYKFEDAQYTSTTLRRKYIDFATSDRMQSTIFQSASVGDSNSYIPTQDSRSMTFETDIIFPHKQERGSNHYYDFEGGLTSSMFGCHQANDGDAGDYTWHLDDSASFQVYALREENNSAHVRFMLTSSNPNFPTLTSSLFKDVYDNNRWTFAVRFAPEKAIRGNKISGSSDGSSDWLVDFYGVNVALEQAQNQFHVSSSVQENLLVEEFLNLPKRIYAGAHRTNFTGSVVNYTDIKLGSVSVWDTYLTNENIKLHAIDPNNMGHIDPYGSAYLFEHNYDPNVDGVRIPNAQTQILNWQFGQVTGSSNGIVGEDYYDGSAWNSSFEIIDMSSGSLDTWAHSAYDRYQQHYIARGDWFLPSDNTLVNQELISIANQNLPEKMSGEDMVSVLETDDRFFTRDSTPTKHFLTIEKNMSQIVSQEMIDFIGSIKTFNNIVGEPINRYRQEYKALNKLREMFFRRVDSEIDFNKFIEYYRWIDAALSDMIMSLVPATLDSTDGLKNTVESHILERNKYWNKFPTLEIKAEPIVGYVKGVRELKYDWEHGHAPVSSDEADNCAWWSLRAEASGSTSGNDEVDNVRNIIRRVVTSEVTTNKIISTGEYTDPIDYPNSGFPNAAQVQLAQSGSSAASRQEYKGSTFALRRFSKPYKMEMGETTEIRGGINSHKNKRRDAFKTWLAGPETQGSSPVFAKSTPAYTDDLLDCDDTINPSQKEFHSYGLNFDGDSGTDLRKGSTWAPFNLVSSSAASNDSLAETDIDIVNIHTDGYGYQGEVPMQGPFAERHVGGMAHRHTDISDGSDTSLNRPENFRIADHTIDVSFDIVPGNYTDSSQRDDNLPFDRFYRDGTAKRPVNIRNIKSATGSQALGNYDDIQQVVHTQTNNTAPWFVKLEAATGSLGVANLISGKASFYGASDTPARPKLRYLTDTLLEQDNLAAPFGNEDVNSHDSRHIFIERFSSPGGPETAGDFGGGFGLDWTTGQYSVYNSINWRNLAVRTPLNALLSVHMDNYGSFSGSGWSATEAATALTGSYHKVNPNAYPQLELDGDDPLSSSVGGWHPPLCKNRYDNWYVQHPIPARDTGFAWINDSVDIDDDDECLLLSTSSFITSSEFGSAINTSGMLLWGYTPAEVASAGTLLDSSHMPTDFVGMNFNIYEPVSSSANTLGYPSGIDLAHATNTAYLTIKSLAGGGEGEVFNSLLLHRNGPYGYPTWKQLRSGDHPIARNHKKNNILSVGDVPETTTFLYKDHFLKSTELHGSRFTNYTEPPLSSKYKSLVHRVDSVKSDGAQTLQPLSIRHTYANNLSMFANPEITNRLGVAKDDRQTYHDIRDAYLNTSLGADVNPIKAFKSLVYAETIYPKEANTYLKRSRMRNNYAETSAEISALVHGDQRTVWRDSLADRAREDGALNSMGYKIYKNPNKGAFDGNAASGSWFLPSGSLSVWPLDSGEDGPNTMPSLAHQEQNTTHPTGDQWGHRVGELYMDPAGTIYASLADADLNAMCGGTHFLAEVDGDSNRLFAMPGTASVCFNHFCLAGTTFDHALAGSNINRRTNEPNHILDWHTNQFAGRNPWYDTYEDYSEDIRRMAKDYTVIPEFRMAEHLDHYIENGFKADNFKFLSVLGSEQSSSADAYDSSYNEQFWTEYCHSDFLKYFGDIQDDHSDLTGVSVLSFKCSAVKKLLPYNGFYPVQRSIQLASLLSSSYGPYLTGSTSASYGDSSTKYNAEQLQSLLQPFYAPGIMYNTLKSCVAVDYPIHTGSGATIVDARGIYGETGQPQLSVNHSGSRRYVDDDPNYRMPFEAIVAPHKYLPLSQSAVLDANDPEATTGKLWLTSPYHGSASFFAQWKGQYKPHYSMAANNFFSEVPNFFLENKTFTTFVSKKEAYFKPMESDVTYYMDVVLYKTDDYVAHEGFSYESVKDGKLRATRGWGYGPPYRAAASSKGASEKTNDPSWAPHAPPYFYGRSVARIKFTPNLHFEAGDGVTEVLKYDLDEILMNAKVETEYLQEVGLGLSPLEAIAAEELETAPDTPAARNRMHVSSSVSLFGKKSEPALEIDPATGEVISSSENPQAGMQSWVINTKFECPSLNFYGAQGGSPDTDGSLPSVPSDPSEPSDASGSLHHRIRGLWNGYGTVPTNGTGIFLGLRESFPQNTNNSAVNPSVSKIGSLIDICGFTPETKQVGVLAENKIISEAVVAIPFVDVGGERKFFALGNTPSQSREIFLNAINGVEGPGKSVRTMAERMSRYVFPPHLDFYTDGTLEPFAMYIFEFSHKLSQQDLSNIWQGVMPDIAVTAKKTAAAITHAAGENEFFGGNPIPDHTRWMVFKVKRRAKTNYFAITADERDDSNFSFNFDTTPQRTPDYTYNWPYDYFSLVELVKMDVKVGIGDNAIPFAPLYTYPMDLNPNSAIAELILEAGKTATQAASLGIYQAKQAQSLVTNAVGTTDPTKMLGTIGGMLGNLPGGGQGGSPPIPPGLMPDKVVNLLGGWTGGTAGGPIVGGDYLEQGTKAAKNTAKIGMQKGISPDQSSKGPGNRGGRDF